MKEFLINDENDMVAFSSKISNLAQHGDVILLNGDLGAGKTVFSRAFIRSYCNDQSIDVPSPTFTLLQTYENSKTNIYHFDLYRLAEAEEIYEIGWEEAIADGISLVEWPERLGDLVHSIDQSRLLSVNIEIMDKDPENRNIQLVSPKLDAHSINTHWESRIEQLK